MISKRFSIGALALALVLAIVPAALAQDDISAVLHVDAGGEGEMEMKLTASGDKLMLDTSGQQGNVSIVWADGVMRMIMHTQRMYMELTEQMMERMRAMGGGMAGGQSEEPETGEEEMASVSFERTGNTDTINGMSAYEVAVTNPDGRQAMLWMTEGTEVGLFQVMTRMVGALQQMAMPGMSMGGGPAGLDQMDRFNELADAQGMPDGRVIRVVDLESGSTITLGEVTEGPFPDSMFEAPEGYTKQTMPFQD